MKIIQICAAYKPAFVYGGPTMSVAKLSEELTKAGHDVTVLATTANGKAELDVPIGQETLVDGVKVYYFKRITKDHTHFSPSLFWFLHQLITKEKKKGRKSELVVHIHAWWNLVSIFSCLIAKLNGVKVVLSPRGMLTSYSLTNRNSKVKNIIHFLLGKKLLKYCYIHATSDKEQRDVRQTCSVNGVTVIPNFVEFPKLSAVSNQETSISNNEIYRLIFLSRIEQKKGLELLFDALATLDIPWQLSIAGSGEPNYVLTLQELAAKLKINDKIKWLGHIKNDHKFNLIANQDLLILTSYNENFANVVIESLAMGTPVLVSEEVGLARYVQENNLGWVSSLTKEHLAQVITRSFSETENRDRIRANSPKKIMLDFDNINLANQYVTIYRN
ncbi:XrtY-associated glycosyltransferase XYAG1 [Pedobacter xixiisoli]|uniref:Glycosyltransferase involved in cell wall bisynthesis n=1 Tax=Pedobacter xixiisoli TaxID=1476464 RepID=A0A286A9K5_9SPHI|nr:glycosyltransferase [Pedobacter xixiisoli]SOD18600.1 Glycosyltransferase involved in cell wall bisynthesis [Pedobacter xixiisoli]